MLKEDILLLLKAGKETYLSGQRISAQLGVSRAAVWKAVEALRKDGYGIDSRSNCGYRLVRVPDVMTQEALSDTGTRQVGRRVLYYDSLDSTNNEIKRLSIDQVENGLAVIADCQTGGRGRRGRSFLSPAGKGLYLSVLMQPRCSVEELSMLTAWSAVALCSAVERKIAPILVGFITFSSTAIRLDRAHSASTAGSGGRRMAHSIPRVRWKPVS